MMSKIVLMLLFLPLSSMAEDLFEIFEKVNPDLSDEDII